MKPVVIVAALAAGVAAYAKLGRPRVLDWGARPEERERVMPGDEILDDATLQTTRAVTVRAEPRHIWPWLVQMGPRPRAGAYTYDWIERLLGIDIKNRNEILPEFQHLEAGDDIAMNEKGQGITVREVRPEEALVLQWVPARSTWTFALYPDGRGRTRLISRNRLPGKGPLFRIGMAAFMEPGSLVMERKMLLTLQRLAEGLAREEAIQQSMPPSELPQAQ